MSNYSIINGSLPIASGALLRSDFNHKWYNESMMSYATLRQQSASLRRFGTWSTWWWGISWAYFLGLVWLTRDNYTARSVDIDRSFSVTAWISAVQETFEYSTTLQALFGLIALGWIIGGLLWLRTLKRHHISYKTALKDLFLTVRK
jgi:hypothetical protein